jgi:FtsP/CotA-like multicopper oxidase with cupredoxin domain
MNCRLSAAPAMVMALLCAGVPCHGQLAAQSHSHGVAHPPGSAVREDGPLPGGRVVEVTLVAAVARVAMVPGSELLTEVYAYNGASPGPVIEAREGDRVVVRFRNDLPEETTVHWHGLHLPFEADGSPFHPVAPGAEHVYAFTLQPGSAGTYWYHPHPHHRTGYQVGRGLFGAFIVRAPDDPLAGFPEQLLVLSDNRFREDGSVDLPPPDSPAGRVDFENGREGDILFVNGAVLPTLPLRAGEIQRWRVVNASGARVYRLHLEGHTFVHVGSDGGLFEAPVEVSEILVASGERVELLVRGSGRPGSRARLQALPYDRYIPQTRPADWNATRDLLAVQYSAEPPVTAPPIPQRLRRVPPLDTAAATVRRVMTMSQGFINGRTMDMTRVDAEARLGDTEIWEIENVVGMDHPFHLHGFQFQLLDRDGVPEPFAAWKDTVNVPRRSSVRFIVRFDSHPGMWMFHCHILSHEDAGMMGVLRVR